MEYNLLQPWKTLDPWQEKYIQTRQNCFLLCGRQSGKSAAMSIKIAECAVAEKEGGDYLVIAFTEKQAYALFRKVLRYLEEKYPNRIVQGKYKPTMHEINIKIGKSKDFLRINCHAAGLTGDGLRHYTLKKLFIDEAGPMGIHVWTAVEPMLSVSGGTVDMSSTPRGKEGFFWECSKREDFQKFYISAEDCPRHSKEFLAEARKNMPKLAYAQEYLAMFLDDLRQVFTEEWIKKVAVGKRRKEIDEEGNYYYGADVARKDIDKFTHEIVDVVGDTCIHVENITTNNIPIPESSRRIIQLDSQYHFHKEYIDSGGMGITVCDILRENDENRNKVVEINNASRRFKDGDAERKKGILKQDLYENLIRLGEQDRLVLLDDEDVILSLRSIQYEITEAGKIEYSGRDSHIVEGLNRACWCMKDKSLNIYIEFG